MKNKHVVWKFILEPEIDIEMPGGAVILSGGIQYDDPVIWALVDPKQPKEVRSFRAYGTGMSFDPTGLRFITTIQGIDGGLVFHIFEVIR